MTSSAAAELKRLCQDPQIRLATAESVTVGRLQSTIGSVSGASNYFQGGLTAYNIDQKVQLLGVDREHAATVNCVSPQVAEQMASGAARIFRADVAVATTGYAEPPEPGMGCHMYFAIWDRRDGAGKLAACSRVDSDGRDRVATQSFFANTVLEALVEYLAGTREAAAPLD